MMLQEKLARERERSARCLSFVRELSTWKRDSVLTCNICDSKELTIIGARDRYGNPIRTGLCGRCGLVFLVDRLTREGYGDFYAKVYRPLVSSYLGRTVTNENIQQDQVAYAAALLRVFDGALSFAPGSTMLDVGGSTGVVATAFSKKFGLKATVLDPSPEELEAAAAEGHAVVPGLLEDWKESGTQFDLIVCARTIDHFFDLRWSLGKLRQLCKVDGYLLIDIIDFDAIRQRKGTVEAATKVDHCYYLTSETAPAILNAAGFSVLMAEIATSQERVTYLCKSSEPKEVEPRSRTWLEERIRALQVEHTNRIDANAAASRRRSLSTRIAGKLARIARGKGQ